MCAADMGDTCTSIPHSHPNILRQAGTLFHPLVDLQSQQHSYNSTYRVYRAP
jgi:hypothetical protein